MDEKNFSQDLASRAPVKEISSRAKELLEELEHLNCLGDQSIYLIALVYLGFKPAAEIGLTFQEGYPDYNQDDYENDIMEVSKMLDKMDLKYEREKSLPDKESDDPTIWTTFYVSQSLEKAKQLRSAFGQGNEPELARLPGYPESAIQAFPDDSIWIDSSEELREHRNAPFLYFSPSRTNWQQEVTGLDFQVEQIRTLMPALYERIVNTFAREN